MRLEKNYFIIKKRQDLKIIVVTWVTVSWAENNDGRQRK